MMNTGFLRNRKGMTMVEVLISAGLLSVVLIGTLVLLSSTLSIWAKGASGTSANSHASLATRRLVTEIEEGKAATVASGKLTVVFPYFDTGTGDYDRAQTGITVNYYLSGTTGSESTGTYLWKSVSTTKTRLATNVESLTFSVTNGKLVRITLTGCDQEGGAISPKTEQISIVLRNS